jgi:hypothetical protein
MVVAFAFCGRDFDAEVAGQLFVALFLEKSV